jgi:hypothetical protein
VTCGIDLGGSGRKGLTRAGDSMAAQTKRRWWSRGAVEGTDKGFEGAHSVGVELGVLTGCSKRGRSGGLW